MTLARILRPAQAGGGRIKDVIHYMKPPREKAARALCNLDGHPPDIQFEGHPMWVSYLPQVDAVIRVALGDDAWRAMVEAEG